MSDEPKPSAEKTVPIALYDALARERERLVRRLAAAEAERDEATSLLQRLHAVDYLPWRGDGYWSNCEFCGAFDSEPHKADCLWLTIGAFLSAHAPQEPPHE